jgi:hypothetical protein
VKEHAEIKHKDKIVYEYKAAVNGIAKIFVSAFASLIISLLLNNYQPIRDWLNSFVLAFNYETGSVGFPIGQFIFYIVIWIILAILFSLMFRQKKEV